MRPYGSSPRARSSAATDRSARTAPCRRIRPGSDWLTGVPENKKADLIPAGWFEQWAEATFATDPVGAKQTPPVLRAPNGVLQDLRTYWAAGKAQYDPANIRVPTLLIHAEWDADLPSDQAHAYFTKLANAPYKRFIELGEGTHTIIMEKN